LTQKETDDRNVALEHVMRVIKIPLATMSRPDRLLALEYCERFNITAKELIEYSHERLLLH
jgi:hypothetical protein